MRSAQPNGVTKPIKQSNPRIPPRVAERGPWCKEDLNRLWPWVEKIWALHPFFPELMGKERTLQGADLIKNRGDRVECLAAQVQA